MGDAAKNEIEQLATFVSRNLVMSDLWEGILDAGRDDLDGKVPRYLAWTTVPQSREYLNMERTYEDLASKYWQTAAFAAEVEESGS